MISDEELELCRKLPPHEPKHGDWYYLHESSRLVMVTTRVDGKGITLNDGKGAGAACPINEFKKAFEPVWLPSATDIMALEEWPLHYGLCTGDWMGIEGWSVVNQEIGGSIEDAPTARLACLRAIEPLLEGDDE